MFCKRKERADVPMKTLSEKTLRESVHTPNQTITKSAFHEARLNEINKPGNTPQLRHELF